MTALPNLQLWVKCSKVNNCKIKFKLLQYWDGVTITDTTHRSVSFESWIIGCGIDRNAIDTGDIPRNHGAGARHATGVD